MTPSTAPPQPRPATRRLAAAAIAVLATAVTASAATRAPHEGRSAAAPAGTAPGWPYPVGSSASATTADLLRTLANTIQDAPADPPTGRYTYHHLRRWILDTTGIPAPRPNTAAVSAIEIGRWEASDGSGLGGSTEPPPAHDLAGAQPDHRSTDGEFAAVPATRTAYHAGHVSSPISASLATDPVGLACQLAVDPLPDGPQSTLGAVDQLYTAHHVTHPTRVAVLQVLAGVDGLGDQPDATDRLGRHGRGDGIAVSLDAGTLRFSLIFDLATGQLLAPSQRLIGPHDHLPVPTGLITHHTLVVDQGRRTDLN